MANRAEKSGINAEMQQKLEKNFPHDKAEEARQWIEDIIEEKLEGGFIEAIQDGSKLCKLLNHLKPGLVEKKFEKPTTLHMKKVDTVSRYLDGCRAYGMAEKDLFVTLDLVDATNPNMVVSSLHSLGRQARKNGYEGPVIGPKEAVANPREFDEDKLREGRNVIGLQMGTNQVASQAGMTPYGKGRQVADTRIVDQ